MLRSIVAMLDKENTSLPVIQLAIQVSCDLLSSVFIFLDDPVFLTLWKQMWSIENEQIRNSIFSFFDSSISILSNTLYEPFLEVVLDSSVFPSLSEPQWTCCCIIWKALNDVNQYIEKKKDICCIDGFV